MSAWLRVAGFAVMAVVQMGEITWHGSLCDGAGGKISPCCPDAGPEAASSRWPSSPWLLNASSVARSEPYCGLVEPPASVSELGLVAASRLRLGRKQSCGVQAEPPCRRPMGSERLSCLPDGPGCWELPSSAPLSDDRDDRLTTRGRILLYAGGERSQVPFDLAGVPLRPAVRDRDDDG